MLFRFTQTGKVVFTDGMVVDVQKSDVNAPGSLEGADIPSILLWTLVGSVSVCHNISAS